MVGYSGEGEEGVYLGLVEKVDYGENEVSNAQKIAESDRQKHRKTNYGEIEKVEMKKKNRDKEETGRGN